MVESKHFTARGKLLISGEYAVLNGAMALAVPTGHGQTLDVKSGEKSKAPVLFWEAYKNDGSLWFSAAFRTLDLKINNTTAVFSAEQFKKILLAVRTLNPEFLTDTDRDIICKTQLEFPLDWGWGSSSTLIWLLAQFAGVDAFELNQLTFNTSGFDVACAGQNSPVFYRKTNNGREIQKANFNPPFSDSLYFVHLNKKQNTQFNVKNLDKSLLEDSSWLNRISEISQQMADVQTLEEFESLMDEHENLISSQLGFKKVKDLYFSDYEGSVKSLGAWGGDFVMVTKRAGFPNYFESKGYRTIISFKELQGF